MTALITSVGLMFESLNVFAFLASQIFQRRSSRMKGQIDAGSRSEGGSTHMDAKGACSGVTPRASHIACEAGQVKERWPRSSRAAEHRGHVEDVMMVLR